MKVTAERYSFARYLNARYVLDPSFSPDGSRLTFLTDITGVYEVWSVPVDRQATTPAWPEQLTFLGERVSSATYSPARPELLVVADTGGSERTQLYLMGEDGAEFTPLTSNPEAIFGFGAWSPDGTRFVYTSNERDARYFDLYEYTLKVGQARLLHQSDYYNQALRYSPDGRSVLVQRVHSNVHLQLLLLDTITGDLRPLTPGVVERQGEHNYPHWSADGRGLYLASNRGRQFSTLAWLELATLEMTYLRDDPWDIEGLEISQDGKRMALLFNKEGYSSVELFDVSQGWEARRELPAPDLPEGVVMGMTWAQDGQRLAIACYPADDAVDVWVWDIPEQQLWRATHSSLGGIPRATLVAPTLAHYPTFDGRQIPAFLYLPQGKEARNLPIIIDVHGGPEGQSRPFFNPVTQYFVGQGYAVLKPNVRGSVGYGYEYQSLDDVRLRMDSVADLQHAALWLRDSGIADPRRIAVMGGSYGGFMVLSAITTYPELWAAAIDIVGVANFVTFLENTGPWRRKHRESEYGSLEHDREFLERISPINHVDNITAPLFVIHGANDPRVPVGEAEQIVAALRARGVPVEYLRFEDEGHGLIKRANKLVAYPTVARFLEEHVGNTP
ncbi:MAG TPA: S9 family peptidase [Ktedonobacteraceae bacterium]|nr:S9 family peptidase [Ktedonobacteraceae bacterium]